MVTQTKKIKGSNGEESREFFIWLNEREDLGYTEKGIDFYINEYLNKDKVDK